MNLLLDTHALIWWMEGSSRFGRQAKAKTFQKGNTVWISVASIWEMAIKFRLGRLQLKDPLHESIPAVLDRGVHALTVSVDHALAIQQLPLHHSDPFDRMLIAQAQTEDLTLVTADAVFTLYDVRVLDAGR